MVAEVLVEIGMLDKTFTYNIPEELLNLIEVGKRVEVLFSSRHLEGFVVAIKPKQTYEYELKDIVKIIDDKAILNEELLKLGSYISKRTLTTLTNSYQAMLPKALKASYNSNINKKYISYLVINTDSELTSNKQKEIYDLIKKEKKVKKEICNNISSSAVKTLLTKKILKEIKEETYRIQNINLEKKERPTLNQDQTKVINQVDLNKYKPYLLYGVTGSGKTEVYMNLIEKVLKNNKTAIMLVPEISLTPQMINVFQSRFGDNIAILHSKLNDGEKYDEYRKILNKEVQIVIGARSAVFAPFDSLGIIIIDEEHSDTYKQESNPKYDAKDIANVRAKYHNCPVVYGSATPSIEDYTKASIGKYELLKLEKRINDNLPNIKLIDMKDEIKKGNRILSEELKKELNKIIQNNEQAIILLNRRGYSTTVTCKNCGYVQKCPNCDIPLTYHKNNNTMTCHYCNYTTYKLNTCPECKSKDINEFGLGTEKLEEELKKIMGSKVIRMDVDTTRKKGSLNRILEDFKNEKYNILIGTQMISKGLDFAKVTLVGVVNGDSSLNMPDFRSAERTYSLLSQVTGRSGRSTLNGRAIIQTYNVDHYSIICAKENNYQKFYDQELVLRKALKYPPYYNLCLIKISGKNNEEVFNQSNKIRTYLNIENTIILGPSYAQMPRVNNVYYMQIIVKYKKIEDIYKTMQELINHNKNNKNIKVDIDFNPIKV